jgi:hypothetical protein
MASQNTIDESAMTQEIVESEKSYSRVLRICTRIGFVLFLGVFAVYVLGIAQPRVSPEKVTQSWHLNADAYMAATGTEPGWAWAHDLSRSDNLCLLAVALLAIIGIICYLTVLPAFARGRDRTYVIIIILQITVWILAASGILARGAPAPEAPAAEQSAAAVD